MEKLSRTEKYKEYRNSLQNDSEKNISTDQLRDLQQRIIEVEKKFGNTSKTEADMNRGYKTSSGFADAYDIFDESSLNVKPTIVEPVKQEPVIAENKTSEFKNDTNSADDYIDKIKALFNDEEFEEVKEEKVEEIPFVKIQEQAYTDVEPSEETKKESIKQEPVKEEPIKEEIVIEEKSEEDNVPDFGEEPEYIPTPKSDTDSIPSVESLISEINSIQTIDENLLQSNEETKEEEKEIAEFVEENKDEAIESALKDIKLEKPVIKHLEPEEDHSKEFSELCESVNKLAMEIEQSSSFARAPYVPPRPELPQPSFESLKEDIKNDIDNDSSMNSFMDQLKKEVKVYNESVENETINTLKDELIDAQRHKEEKPENTELKKEFENTVNSEVSKILDEINSSKADSISADDVMINPENVISELNDIQQGKTIAFDTEDIINDSNKENTIVLSNPYNEQPLVNDASIHTMSFQTEELYEGEEKSSTVLNIILTILIVLAVIALAVIAYFFLLTRGII